MEKVVGFFFDSQFKDGIYQAGALVNFLLTDTVRVSWEEEITVEKMHPLAWPVDRLVGHFLINGLCGRAQIIMGGVLWASGPELSKKAGLAAIRSKEASRVSPCFLLQLLLSDSWPVWVQVLTSLSDGLSPESVSWNKLLLLVTVNRTEQKP